MVYYQNAVFGVLVKAREELLLKTWCFLAELPIRILVRARKETLPMWCCFVELVIRIVEETGRERLYY